MHDQGHDHLPAVAADNVEAAAEAAVGELAGTLLDPSAEWRWTRGDSLRVAIAGFTLALAGFVASQGVPSSEASVFEFLNSLPDALYPLLWVPMQLGNVWVGTGVAALVGLLVRRLPSAMVLVAAPLTGWVLAKMAKDAVGRGRPVAVGLMVEQRGAAEAGLGFISGHTTVAFAVAGAVAAHLHRRSWRAALLAAASVVGVARIYVGAHLPLDVIGGAACGLLLGEAARVAEVRLIRPRRTRRAPAG